MLNKLKKINLILKLRKLGIIDTKVLSAIETVPRENFIDKEISFKSYQNEALPIDCNQTISQPAVVAKMTELLEPDNSSRVLEVGTGSGYQTAILAKLFKRIYTIERFKQLLENAKEKLAELRFNNIVYYYGDGLNGWPAKLIFNRIILTAVSKEIPKKIIKQLSEDNGILVLPIIDKNDQYLLKVIRKKNKFFYEKSWNVKFVPLVSGID